MTHLITASKDETAALLFVCGDQYLFRHRTRDGGMAYKFLSARSVRAAFSEELIDTAWLPPSVRRYGIGRHGEWFVFAHPPSWTLSFADDEHKEPITLDVPLPGLAFLGYQQHYHVWAFRGKKLGGETILFAAPLPNVDANGAICFGANLVPTASVATIEETWHLFLSAPFTSHSVNGKSKAHADDVREQLVRLAKGSRRRYPLNDLVSTNRTANQLVDWILKSHH